MRLRNKWLVSVALSLVLGLGLFVSGVRADADCCPDRPNVQLNCQRNACSYGTCLSQCSTQKNGVSILIPYYDDVPGMEFIFGDATVEGLGAIISRALQIIFASIGLLFLVYLLYGGFTIASAMGAPEQVDNGKKIITRAVIGLLIMFMSFWMVQLVELILGLEIFRSDGLDEPIPTPGNTAEVVEGPAPLVAINEPPPGAKEWGYDADLVATLPFDERNLPEYAGARFCYQKTGEAYQYLRTPALAYGAAAEGAVLGAQLAQGTPLPPGWTVLNEPESTCIDVLFDETLTPPDGSDGVLYQQPADKLTVPVVFDKLSDYTWQVGTWVRGEDGTLVPSDYSPTSTFETGVNATPPTPTPPLEPGKQQLQFNFMTYNFPSGDPAKLQQIADYIEANNLSVVMFQEFTDEGGAKETMYNILQGRDPDWRMISTKYDDSKLTDSYTIYAKWNLRALAEMNLNHERKAVTAIADTPVGALRLFIVHTSAREGTRYVCDQLNAYITFINQAIADDIPYVIAGDFNAELNDLGGYPNCPTVKEWFRTRHQISCVDARMNSVGQCDFSFGSEDQSRSNGHVIDYVLVPNDNPDIIINQAWVSKTRYLGEDEHYPVLATITIRGVPKVTPKPRIYRPNQSDIIDNRMSARIEGVRAPMVRHTTYHPDKSTEFFSSRLWFAHTGPLEVEISNLILQNPELRGIGTNLPIQRQNGNTVLKLPGPGLYYLVGSNTDEKVYIWYDDVYEVQRPNSGRSVINVNDKGVYSATNTPQTTNIQQLIDTCPQNCTLYFPPGVYRTGHLNIHRDNITIYVDDGAIIKGTDNAFDFMTEDFGNNMINIRGNNVTIAGPGTIDANGMKTYGYQGAGEVKIHTIDVDDSRNLTLRNTLFMDSNSWNIHLRKSSGVTIENIKIFSGKDGLDIDSTSNVSVDTIFVESIDDNIPMKTRYNGIETANVYVKNCMVKTRASSLKIGTENRATIRDITFDTCEVIDGQRALNIAPDEPEKGAVQNVTYKNIRIFMSNPIEGQNGLAIRGSNGGANVGGVRYENIVSNMILENTFQFNATVSNSRFYMLNPVSDNRPNVFRNNLSRADVDLNNVTIYWLDNKNRWGGLYGGDGGFNPTNVQEIDGLNNVPPMAL